VVGYIVRARARKASGFCTLGYWQNSYFFNLLFLVNKPRVQNIPKGAKPFAPLEHVFINIKVRVQKYTLHKTAFLLFLLYLFQGCNLGGTLFAPLEIELTQNQQKQQDGFCTLGMVCTLGISSKKIAI
jgi:hypothetical protein